MMNRMAFNNYQSMNMVHRSKDGTQLWLGDYYAATNLNLLKQKNVRSVLTSAAMLGVNYPKQQEINHKIINAFDIPSYKMTPHFEEAFRFIDQSLKKGNLLVHCAAGISRSTTFVLVYLMRAENMSFQQALGYVSSKRSIVCPNYGFQNELKRYETVLKKKAVTSKNEKEPDTLAEKKAVINFLNEEQNQFINQKQKLSATTGSKYSHFGQKASSNNNKTGDYNAFIRGKSVNYQPKERMANQSVDYRSKANNFAKGFLTYKMEPKVVTIKK